MPASLEFLSTVPEELRGAVEHWWERACDREDFSRRYAALSEAHRTQLPAVVAASEFVAQALIQDPATFDWIGMDSGAVALASAERANRTAHSDSAEQAMTILREWRRRAMARIAWR